MEAFQALLLLNGDTLVILCPWLIQKGRQVRCFLAQRAGCWILFTEGEEEAGGPQRARGSTFANCPR